MLDFVFMDLALPQISYISVTASDISMVSGLFYPLYSTNRVDCSLYRFWKLNLLYILTDTVYPNLTVGKRNSENITNSNPNRGNDRTEPAERIIQIKFEFTVTIIMSYL